MRLIVFALLAGAAVTAASENENVTKACEPGKSFKNYCNSCKCSDDGTFASCTLMLCPPGYNENGSRNENFGIIANNMREKREIISNVKKQVCEPGKSFQNYCNSCKCSDDGTVAVCTFVLCPPGYNEDGSMNELRESREISKDVKPKICEPNKIFSDYCNVCICSPDGTSAGCTLMLCPPGYNKDGSRNENWDVPAQIIREKRDISSDVKKQVCEPNKIFFDYCNGCICSSDGTSATCTLKFCTSDYNKDGSRNEDWDVPAQIIREKRDISNDAKKQVCEPDKVFKKSCNYCRCSPDGSQYICTLRGCPSVESDNDSRNVNSDVDASIIREKRKVSGYQKLGPCEPLKIFWDKCNACICSEDGKRSSCTDVPCSPDSNKDVSKNVCEPGKSFKKYCNTCVCSEDGTSAGCTRKACVPGMYNEDGTLNPNYDPEVVLIKREAESARICEPGKSFKEYCNSCVCSKDGTFASCTRMACIPGMYNENGTRNPNFDPDSARNKRETEAKKICEPGKSFKEYCNSCVCSKDGTFASCTRMACIPGMYNENGTRNPNFDPDSARNKRETEAKKICEPGKSFKEYCNSCVCSKDGTFASCTRMACIPGMYNENGTRNPNFDPDSARNKRETEATKICEHGKPFKYYCNNCACSEDGKPFACTKMYCPPGMFNEDGSINPIGSYKLKPIAV